MIAAAIAVWAFFAAWLVIDGQSLPRSLTWPLHVVAACCRKTR